MARRPRYTSTDHKLVTLLFLPVYAVILWPAMIVIVGVEHLYDRVLRRARPAQWLINLGAFAACIPYWATLWALN